MKKSIVFVVAIIALALLSACGGTQATPMPTRTPKPDIYATARADVEAEQAAEATATAQFEQAVAEAIAAQPTQTPLIITATVPVTIPAPSAPQPEGELVTAEWPTTPEEFLTWTTKGQPLPDESWMPIEIGEIHTCVGEDRCWAVAREKDLQGQIIPFWVSNPTSCMQDGWMNSSEDRARLGRTTPASAAGSGIPAGWSGLVQGLTFRPCD